MDGISVILAILKAFIERMKSIVSYIVTGFFPSEIETTTNSSFDDDHISPDDFFKPEL